MYRILCVDDEQNILNSLRRLFRREGYELVLFSNAQEALEFLKAHPVQLILSDQRMPGTTGVSFLTQAKELQPDAIRIILSGYSEVGLITEAINKGNVYKFIFKPWNDDDLRQTVKLALQQYDLVEKNKELQKAVMRQNEELKQLNQDLEKGIAERTEELTLRNKGLIFYQDALENLPMAVIGISGDGMIAFTNKTAQQYFDNVLMLGSHIDEVFPEEISKLVKATKESRRAQRLSYFNYNNQSLAVESVVFSTSGNNGAAAKRDGIILVMQPCAKEEELRESENRYRQLYDEAPVGYHEINQEGRIVRVNQTEASMLGYTVQEMIGKPVLDFLVPEQQELAKRAVKEKLARQRPLEGFERKYVCKDGKVIDVFIEDRLSVDKGGRITGIRSTVQNITERKRAEEAVRQQREWLRVTLSSIGDGVIATDTNGRVTFMNHVAQSLTGWKQDDAAGKPLEDVFNIINEETRNPVENPVMRVIREGVVCGLANHTVLIARDGTEIPIDDSGAPIRDDKGNIIGAVLVFHDITERKRMEKALWDSKAFYHSLVESLPQNIFRKDLQGRFTFGNKRFCALLGKSLDEIVGKTDLDFFPAELAEKYRRDDRGVIETGEAFETVEEHQPPGGEKIYVRVVKTPIYDFEGKIIGTQGIFWDVTERKRVEEALQRNERYFRSLIENASDIITILNSDGTIRYESHSAERMLGYKPEDLVGKSTFEFIHPGDLPNVINTFNHVIQNPGVPLSTELRFRHKDGSWRTLEVIGNNLLNDSVVAGVVVNSRDITDRRQAEEALRQSEERLLHSQKMEGIGRLAGGVAHDFNNLLTAIIGYSQLLMDSLSYSDPRRRSVEEIKKAGERAAALTRQLLAFSRKQVLQPTVLDLNAVVADTEKLLRRLIGEDIDLVIVPSPALGRVKADSGQIEQVIMNLALNARDAMPEGGKLTIETANVDLDETYAREHTSVIPGCYVMLVVSDNGCGMDAETQSHLFEPFFTTKEQGKGTGLGLATVYGIVKQSGGHIWVYSEPHQGTTFRIYLPRIEEAVKQPELNAATEELARGSETVLLVEDEEAVRSLAHEVLKRNGYNVLEACNGSEALMLCGRHTGPIHLIVTDVVMPGMNGRDLVNRLAPLRPETKVLYMSGYTNTAIVHQGVLDPGTAFLQKPFTPDVLARKVREVLDVHQKV